MNFALRMAIDKAKAVNMPKDNIERAIKHGTGELKDGAALQEALFEGFGPGGAAVVVEAVTDNNNRIVSDIKHVFARFNCSLGGPGSVKWQFLRRGVVRINNEQLAISKLKRDEFDLSLMDAGVEDIISSELGLEIRCPVESFQKVMAVIKEYGLESEHSGLEWVAKETVKLSESDSVKLQEFYDALEELDDVREVYTNEG
ncbi:MAG: YebC/PmpR family DNA-binding transcriptional regulator, partial [Candidatus Magasanikbacteria bacterium]|nr:YebC/PmpR family DNA-binding transcriptional regulator [Candidatus Magasanikbacteria bacterium]